MTLREVLDEYGIELEDEKIELLEEYISFLVSSPVNLTSMEKEEIYHKGIAEVLYPLREFPILERFIDVGTGGGIPGVVISVAFDVEGVLVDSRKKKIELLSEFVLSKGLNLETIWARAEDLGKEKEHRESYMYAVAKALARTVVALELLAPFVAVGGYVLLYKGPRWKEELEESWRVMDELGLDLGDVLEYELKTGEKRALVIVEKYRSTPRKYPRKTGLPKKRPLR